jgi:hypothetical protein
MRTYRALLAVVDLYDLVLQTRFQRQSATARRHLLELVQSMEECFHDIDDGLGVEAEKRRLDDALYACQQANKIVVELRTSSGCPSDELNRAEALLAHAGHFLCEELLRLDPRSGRRYERFH